MADDDRGVDVEHQPGYRSAGGPGLGKLPADVGVLVAEDAIPVRAQVRGAAELLGIDPLYVACEGRLVAVVDGSQAEDAVAALRAHPLGAQAATIGEVTADPVGLVTIKTTFGGTRIVDLLVGDPLPRIC